MALSIDSLRASSGISHFSSLKRPFILAPILNGSAKRAWNLPDY